jgi:flagellar protein FliT
MDNLQQFLQVSAKLYQHLTDVPKDEERDAYIEMVHQLLDERSLIMHTLQNEGFVFDAQNKSHQLLENLDKGIKNRLNKVLTSVQEDLKTIKNAKKNEMQYMNPYANVAVMDGRYYDKKN